MGETRVNLKHLLTDLKDAYPRSLEETIITEAIANSLDSGASEIELLADAGSSTLTIRDNGRGMSREALRRFHDIASSTKQRGQGIGFAGVGIKLGLLVSKEVRTETRKNGRPLATTWKLSSTKRAPWAWASPEGMVDGSGTAVTFHLTNPLGKLADPAFLERVIRRDFHPLLDPTFDSLLARHYHKGIAFKLNGRPLARVAQGEITKRIRLKGQRGYSGLVRMSRSETALGEGERGIAISAFGKVILCGWDWLGVLPAEPDLISGLVEVPALARSLTLNKGDFLRTDSAGATFFAYRNAIQEAVSEQLNAWGMSRKSRSPSRPSATAPSEKEIEEILAQISESFPLLTPLVDRLQGGQHRLPMAPGGNGNELGGKLSTRTVDEEKTQHPDQENKDSSPGVRDPVASDPKPMGRKRRSHYRLRIEYETRPESERISRLERSTVWINQSHPAYIRATSTRSTAYHLAIAAATALAPIATGSDGYDQFLAAFLKEWGNTGGSGAR